MQERFYILSTKYNIQERKTKKNGTLYDVVFYVISQTDGVKRQKKLSGYATKTKAKEAYTTFVMENCDFIKKNPYKQKNIEKKSVLVCDLIKEYTASLQNQNKDSTVYDKIKIYQLFVLPTFANSTPEELTTQALYHWQDKLWSTRNQKSGEFLSYKYLCKIRTYFSAFLQWAESRYRVANNLKEVQKPKRRAPKRQMQIWTREEFDRFIAVVDDDMYRAFFSMLFFTGRRKGEVMALYSTDVYKDYIVFDKSVMRKTLDGSTYNITNTKNEKKDKTPICATLRGTLSKYVPQQPFYFGGEKPLIDQTIRRRFNQYCAIAEVPQIRIHDLRHSFVSMCVHLGATIPVVADLIGDTIEQVTRTYAHLYETDKIKIIEKIG